MTNNILSWVILVVVILGFGCIYYAIPETPVIPKYNIPTAQDIASQVVIPMPNVPEMPEIPPTWLSLREKLKNEALKLCDNEFDMDDVEDLFGNDDNVDLIKEYEDDRDFSNINVGLDQEDDRTITIERVYKVEVEPDLDDDYKDKVYVTCEVTSDDGDLEADIDYTL